MPALSNYVEFTPVAAVIIGHYRVAFAVQKISCVALSPLANTSSGSGHD